MKHLSTRLTLGFLLPAAPSLAQAPLAPLETWVAPGATSGDLASSTISLGADWLAAGLPNRALQGLNGAGAAALWPRSGSTLGAPSIIESPTPATSGSFGADVAVDGGTLLVTERSTAMFGGPSRGAAHRFELASGAWSYVDSIESPVAGPWNHFGTSCALDGDLAVIGAPFESIGPVPAGAAHVYRLVGGAWQHEAQLLASDLAGGDQFGKTVAIDGERVVVGAPAKLSAGVVEGAAYVFELSAGAWVEVARIAVDVGAGDEGLGAAVDVFGDVAVVGATRTNSTGAAYVLRRASGAWTREQRLQPAAMGDSAQFGESVAVVGGELLVGASQDRVGGHLRGTARAFTWDGVAWRPTVRLQGATAASSALGRKVQLDGAGACFVLEPFGSPTATPSTGALHAFEVELPFGVPFCTPVANSLGRFGGIAAFGSPRAADDDVELVAWDLPGNAFGFFLTSRAQGSVAQPGGSVGVLCLGGAIGRYVGPGEVQNSGALGQFELALDLGATPTPTGLVSITAGETWSFQAWYRDLVGGQVRSNFTDAVAVGFQ